MAYIVLGIAILFVILIRLRLSGVPLERDEGEYAYMGQLLLQGILPYDEAYNMKFPGIYFVYAIILAVFGQTHTGIHLALLVVNVATSILLFLLGRRLFNNITGIVAGISFLVMTLSPAVEGFWANSEHFVIFFAIGGILLMLNAVEGDSRKQIFFSGLLLGAAFLVKQHGIFFSLFGLIYVCWVYLKKRPLFWGSSSLKFFLFIIGIITPLSLVIMLFLIAGNFDKFYFWTFEYASEYASMLSISQGLANFKRTFAKIIQPNLLILLIALSGFLGIVWNKAIRSRWIFTYGFLVASFLSISPGFYFRPHYYILLIPALSLFSGIGAYLIVTRFFSYNLRVVVSGIVIVSLIYPVIAQKDFLFKLTPVEASRVTYGLNPFPESLEIARYINKNTNEADKIAVIGSEPQIYFYSKRKAATGFLYTYALMEPHKFAAQMQREMINEIESSRPKYIVLVIVPTSWLVRPNSEKLLMNWVLKYLGQNYKLSGIVDIVSPNSIIYKWDKEAVSYSPRSRINLAIFRKKSHEPLTHKEE